MAYVLFRNMWTIVALDEKGEGGPRLFVTHYNMDSKRDEVIADFRIPDTGIEILTFDDEESEPEEAPKPVRWAPARDIGSPLPQSAEHQGWRREETG